MTTKTNMLPSQILPDLLEQAGILNKTDITKTSEEADCKSLSLEDCILKKRLVTPDLLYKAAATYFKLPFISLLGQVIPKSAISAIPESIARAHQIIPFALKENVLQVAVLNPYDAQTLEFIEKKTNFKIELFLTDPESIKDALKQYKQSLENEFAEIAKANTKPIEELAQEAPVVRIVEALLEHAILRGTSDIHIEPGEKEVAVRFRIDGILREIMTLPKQVLTGVVARIKILSHLKIDEHSAPQDGRFKFQIPSYKVSIRVSIFPMFDGEKIVMRVLYENARLIGIQELGFEKKQLEIIMRNIQKPHGMLLVTGPTGSGKTTTLYAFLTHLNKPGVNISTVEDPVEYRMPGVNQSQINPKVGFTFATGLRSLLRQDPDIIMVGEIRDQETAGIAINAALTGHLVLSTLHTNDAVTSIPRLIDLGAPAFLVAQTANVITAQRLVRRLCSHCTQSHTVSPEEAEELNTIFDVKTILQTLKNEGAITSSATSFKGMRFFKGAGCPMCGKEGYRGRLAIHEILEITPAIATLIYNHSGADEMHAAARKQGMLTLVEDGFIKAKQGLTSISEILRVTKE